MRRQAASVMDMIGSGVARVRSRGQLLGYIGAAYSSNLGDRAVFEAFERFSCAPRQVIASAAHERRLSRVRLDARSSFRRVVLGGGTIINDYTIAIVEELVAQGARLSVVGAGVGRGGWDNESTVIEGTSWPRLLSSFEHVGVRGPASARMLQRAGVRSAVVDGDLALALARDPRRWRPRPIVLLNGIRPPGDATWSDGFRRSCRELAEHWRSRGARVLGLVMHPDDEVANQELFGHGETFVPRNSDAFIATAAEAEFLFSMRLHGGVLGVCSGAPVALVAYLDKVRDFAESVHASAVVSTDGEFDVAALVESARAERERVSEAAFRLGESLRARLSHL
jgi:hypothetical protein